jgi:predicted DNA-binding antitoxin AbrB/MazE fold protein
MNPIPVIYENGVFRPTIPVVLPEGTTGEAVVTNGADGPPDGNRGPKTNDAASLDRIYKLLEQGAETGITDLAARHNEHQP